MTNQEIILKNRIQLMQDGVIGTTGRQIKIRQEDGMEAYIPEPEQIHTYTGWIVSAGYRVRRGEKAIAKFPIWKHQKAHLKMGENGESVRVGERLFLTEAFFFRKDQCDPLEDDNP